MSAKFIAGALGLVFLLVSIAGMPDIGDTLGLFSAGAPLNAVHLLVGVVLSIAAFSAGRARVHLNLAAVGYGVIALFGLNKAVTTNWPELFDLDGRWMAACLAPLLALGAMIARDGPTTAFPAQDTEASMPVEAKVEQASPTAQPKQTD